MSGEKAEKPTHMLSLTVQTSNTDDWNNLWKGFADLAGRIAPYNASVNVHSTLLDDEELESTHEEVKYDDQTLNKVYEALCRSGITEARAGVAINEMLNAGILFRERA